MGAYEHAKIMERIAQAEIKTAGIIDKLLQKVADDYTNGYETYLRAFVSSPGGNNLTGSWRVEEFSSPVIRVFLDTTSDVDLAKVIRYVYRNHGEENLAHEIRQVIRRVLDDLHFENVRYRAEISYLHIEHGCYRTKVKLALDI